jgi:hypothetical protein
MAAMKLLNPYAGTENLPWLRGNLHAHTTVSDGQRSPQAVVNDYARRGYDFLMISDHDVLTDAAAYAKLRSRGLVLIPGNEISARGPHLLHVDADGFVPPLADRQKVIKAINRGRGLAVINHPNWLQNFNHCPFEKLAAWQGYAGIEIYNGTIGRLHGSPYATDKWDRLLAAGRRVWGFAHDDSHLAKEDVGLGWLMVAARERTVAEIMAALRQGAFYASTGVTIRSIRVQGRRVTVHAPDAGRIVALREVGRRIAQVDGTKLTVTMPADATYLRFECYGRGEARAWTQPIFPTE